MEYYAHSLEGKPASEWHDLHDHLLGVASLAKQFAEAFNAGDWAYLAGLWHPLKPRSKNPKFYKSWTGEGSIPNVEAVCAKWEGMGTPEDQEQT